MLAYDITNLLNNAALQTPYRGPSSQLDKQGFLELLVKQMSSQDPLDPMTNDEFVSQLAMFGSLEQQINLNSSFTQFFQLQQLTQASTLIGKEVISIVASEDGVTPVSGVVEQVMLMNGTAYLRLSSGYEIPLASVVDWPDLEERGEWGAVVGRMAEGEPGSIGVG